mmetsp:Transcript_13630/g.27598  ORF Transcript_13630/g.27598 Transcript_13630/m.27598 type:complete len:206 (+) Transcript_13630:605-1222(+)
MPRLRSGESHARCPRLVVSVRYACIPIAVVDHNAHVLEECRVCIPRQIWARRLVVPALCRRAACPREIDGLQVHGINHLLAVHIRCSSNAVDTSGKPCGDLGLPERGFERRVCLAEETRGRKPFDALAIHVVDVKPSHDLRHLIEDSIARIADGPREIAAGVCLVLERLRNKSGAHEEFCCELVTIGSTDANFRSCASISNSNPS